MHGEPGRPARAEASPPPRDTGAPNGDSETAEPNGAGLEIEGPLVAGSDGDRIAVIRVSGEIDLGTVSELEAALARASRSAGSVCVDLSGCTFIDSTGLRVLLTAARDRRDAGGELAVSGLTGTVESFFSITGLLIEGSPLRVRPGCPPPADAYK